ncbi:phosphatidate cytidylyltransferase [Pseudochryseolinea flava]|uniref:Phosphatidate cytidylyltransferase n=1 Tax=Pseudochryseolinea flava TaxID=2059302 RepID=A0A364Y1H0_9BACT|nr:phosphatidate cytidylyltransferase [Pseudochryseolinea flava]RAW00451.1 phosphatidate cytidylyltransferase [Pseudochryseolinea flava]
MKNIFHMDFMENKDLMILVYVILGILLFATLLFYIVGKLKPQAKLGELKARTKSWWVMATLVLGATLINTTACYIAIALLSFVAFRELYSVLGFRESDRRAIFWAYVAIPIQYYLAYIKWYGAYIIFIPIVMFLFLQLRLVLKGNTTGIIKSMASLQWMLMLTVFGISHMAYLLSLPNLPNYDAGGRGLLLFLVFLTEINDVMQFTWGKLLGKHKIIPKVSPNKTWEGFIGGVISTTIIGYFLGFLTPLSVVQVVCVSFVLSCAGFFGDIVMSSVKRDIGIKDMGASIPGHGGVLDRIDSLAYTAPVFFHLVYYLAYPSVC